MKEYNFKHISDKSKTKGLIIGLVYLIVVFLGCYFLFGGINGMADAVNNFGSAKGIGLLVGIAFLAPLIIMIQFIHPKITIEVNSESIVKKDKNANTEKISISSISKMQVNIQKINELRLFDKDEKLLLSLTPFQRADIISKIVDEILKHKAFNKDVKIEKQFGNNIEKTTYIAK